MSNILYKRKKGKIREMITYKQLINKAKEIRYLKDIINYILKLRYIINSEQIKVNEKEYIMKELGTILNLLELELFEKENKIKDKKIKIKTINDLIKLDII